MVAQSVTVRCGQHAAGTYKYDIDDSNAGLPIHLIFNIQYSIFNRADLRAFLDRFCFDIERETCAALNTCGGRSKGDDCMLLTRSD